MERNNKYNSKNSESIVGCRFYSAAGSAFPYIFFLHFAFFSSIQFRWLPFMLYLITLSLFQSIDVVMLLDVQRKCANRISSRGLSAAYAVLSSVIQLYALILYCCVIFLQCFVFVVVVSSSSASSVLLLCTFLYVVNKSNMSI